MIQPQSDFPGQQHPLQNLPQQPTGAARAIAFARSLSGSAILLAGLVFGLQAIMPEGRRPSDLIGSFHGSTNTAQLDAERIAQTRTTESLTEAQTRPTALWNMEAHLSQTQQQLTASSLGAQVGAANLADFACLAAGIASALMDDQEVRTVAMNVGQTTCGMGDQIRDNMNAALVRAQRQGSGVMQRPGPTPVADRASAFAPLR